MQMTFFHADCVGKAANCSYPHKVVVANAGAMESVVAHDHVCATYKNNYRSKDNFLESDVIPMDIDNDHSDNPADWITEDKMDELFGSIDYALVPKVIMKERADSMPNKDPILTAFSGIISCGNCGASVSRRTSKYGKKWICNTKERKGKCTCDFRDIFEIELEGAAAKVLNLDSYNEELARSSFAHITLDNAYITFCFKNGTKKKVLRKYMKGYSGFSSRFFCGQCGGMLEADTWKIGPVGKKVKHKVWNCRKCSASREFDSVLRKAATSLFKEKNCEGLFAQNIEKAINYADRIDFYYKEGSVVSWRKE